MPCILAQLLPVGVGALSNRRLCVIMASLRVPDAVPAQGPIASRRLSVGAVAVRVDVGRGGVGAAGAFVISGAAGAAFAANAAGPGAHIGSGPAQCGVI